MGADINTNVGCNSQEDDDPFALTLRPHGLSKRNSKGKNLLPVYMSYGLQVMNTHHLATCDVGHRTWISTLNGKQSMLDIMVCLTILHKRINNFRVILDGQESDHRAACLDLVLISVKFKETQSLYSSTIDWRKILTKYECRKIYNNMAF